MSPSSILLTSLTLLVCLGCQPPASQAPSPIRPVKALIVKAQQDTGEVRLSGEIRPRRETMLAFRVAGKVIERLVDVGASVSEGQLLARLEPTDYQLQSAAANAQLKAAQADFSYAKAELGRYTELLNKKFISDAEYQGYRNAFNLASAKLDQARSQYQNSLNQSSYTKLLATADGVITGVDIEQGSVVAAGQPVMRLAQPDELEVAISLPENRLKDIQQHDAPFEIQLWAQPEPKYQGQLREISPNADPLSRTYPARIRILNPDSNLAFGMTASLSFRLKAPRTLIRLPMSAIWQQDQQAYVWILDRLHAKAQPVTTGDLVENDILIESGLKDGDQVVIAGVHKLQPNQQVRILPDPKR